MGREGGGELKTTVHHMAEGGVAKVHNWDRVVYGRSLSCLSSSEESCIGNSYGLLSVSSVDESATFAFSFGWSGISARVPVIYHVIF